MILFSTIEPSVSVIAACLPTLMPLFRKLGGIQPETWSEQSRQPLRALGGLSLSKMGTEINIGSEGTGRAGQKQDIAQIVSIR